MKMLKERDRDILCFIEKVKGISIRQCADLFFNGSYEGARRRLRQIEVDYGKLKSYQLKETGEKIYYMNKKISYHNLIALDFLSNLKIKGAGIIDFKLQPHYMNNKIIPDMFCVFSLNDKVYFTLLEVDLYHNTPLSKMQLYEQLYKTGELQNECFNNFPILIVCKSNKDGLRYSSNNFNTIYVDKHYNSLYDLLITL